jgi:hypothetical protein
VATCNSVRTKHCIALSDFASDLSKYRRLSDLRAHPDEIAENGVDIGMWISWVLGQFCASRKETGHLGLQELDCVIHPDLDDTSAMLLYFHLNLNRVEVERDHIRIFKLFAECSPQLSVDDRVELLQNHCSWEPKRIREYVEIHERGKTWREFTFTGRGKKHQPLEWE